MSGAPALRVAVLIPARDEERTLPQLLASLSETTPRRGWLLAEILVVNNGSTDRTAAVASAAGARVVDEPRRGYGRACQAGLAHLALRPPDVVVFLDADDFEAPRQLGTLLEPLRRGEADLVIGERRYEPGAGVRLHAALGNRLVCAALRVLYRATTRDMGPFRAVRWSVLRELRLDDPDYGWYVQMQVRALRAGYRVEGVPVAFARRTVGDSKISGSLRGSLAAGWVMLRTLLAEAFRRSGR